MKKTTTTLALAVLFSMAFVSCKKNYTCTCDVSANIPFFGQVNTTTSESLGKQTKRDAQNACDAVEKELEDEFMGYGTASCNIIKS